jgi:hypothetical protein
MLHVSITLSTKNNSSISPDLFVAYLRTYARQRISFSLIGKHYLEFLTLF